MAIRKKQEPDEYQKALRKFHKKSNRHVVVFEADISEDEKRRIFSDADHLRQCGNELLGIMERNLEQLLRTKRYRALQKLYGKVSDPIHALEKKEVLSDEETQKLNHLKKERAEITNSMNQMRESYQVTWDFCRTKMMELKEKYHLQSIFAFPVQKIFGLQLKRYCIRAEESYISKSAEIFRRFGQNNPHGGLSLILLSQG